MYLKDSFDDLADLFPQMLNETCSKCIKYIFILRGD